MRLSTDGGGSSKKDGQYELVQPYFSGEIRLEDEHAQPLRPGERVRIKFRSEEGRSFGARARARFLRFVDHVFASTASS